MAATVYLLGVLISAACAWLLLRGYIRSQKRLLLWSGICFAIFAVSNALVFIDIIVFPNIDLYRYRLATALIAMAVLLYGLIWETD